MLKPSKKKAKKDKFCGLQREAVMSVQSTDKNRVINNGISKRKQIMKQKKNLNKLSNILKQNKNTKTGSSLSNFLQSLNQSKK